MTNPGEKELKRTYVNPLSPSIHMQILQTDLHTSTLRISWENLIKYHGIFFMVIILLILITLSLDSVWILLGENWCWTLLGLKWLISKCISLVPTEKLITEKSWHQSVYWLANPSFSWTVFSLKMRCVLDWARLHFLFSSSKTVTPSRKYTLPKK